MKGYMEGYNLQKGKKIYAPKHVQFFFLQDKVSIFIDKRDTVDFTYFFSSNRHSLPVPIWL